MAVSYCFEQLFFFFAVPLVLTLCGYTTPYRAGYWDPAQAPEWEGTSVAGLTAAALGQAGTVVYTRGPVAPVVCVRGPTE